MSDDTLEKLAEEIGNALAPLEEATKSVEAFDSLLMRLGFRANSIPRPILDLSSGLTTIVREIEQLVDGAADPSAIERLMRAIQEVVSGIDAIATAPASAFPPELLAAGFREQFPGELVQFLLAEYLIRHQRDIAFLLRALGVLRTEYREGSEGRAPVVLHRFEFSDLPRVLEDPSLIFKYAYGWGTDDPDFATFFRQIDNFLVSLGVDTAREAVPWSTVRALENGTAGDQTSTRHALKAVFFHYPRPPGSLSASLGLFPLPGDGSLKPGLAILPEFNGALDLRMSLGGELTFAVSAGFEIQGGVGIVLRPERPIDLLLGFEAGSASHAEGNLEVKLEVGSSEGDPEVLLEAGGLGRIEMQTASGKGGLYLDSRGADLYLEVELQGGKLVIDGGQGDSFLKDVLPPGGLAATLDLAVGLSLERGFYFRGSAGLEIAIPTHVSLGPIELEGLRIHMMPKDGTIPITAGSNVRLLLGPLRAVIEDLGLRATLAFPEGGGNLGPLDFSMDFKPPTGIGLSIDAGGFKGGGFLSLNPDEGRYAGALELSFQNLFTLKAVGLLTTKLPDGSEGYSLLVIISAEFEIQIGFGFTLSGVGGLLGLHRTARIDALRAGVKSNTLSSILFPKDPVENIQRILSDLETVFPAERDRFVFGPMLKIGWGSPSLLTIEVGLVIEVPSPVRVAILGIIRAILPDEEAEILKLQVNFLGAWEEDKKLISFDASLFDSRLLTFTLSGDMALRIAYGDEPNFLISVGGFHPAYRPPPLALPEMERLSLNLTGTDNPRLALRAYFAITSNTVQVGASIELLVQAWEFSIYGFLGFDALFQFSPFYFIVSIRGALGVRIGSVVLFSIELSLSLEGPTPWRAHGTASFQILFFSIDASFSLTWGEDADTTLPDVPMLPRLEAALADRHNWTSELPSRSHASISRRDREGHDTGLLVDPAGSLVIRQRVLPLDTPIDKVGAERPSDGGRFFIRSMQAGGSELSTSTVEDRFAPAQHFSMSEAEKLSSKSFQKMPAGVRVRSSSRDIESGPMSRRAVEYERIVIDTKQRFLRFLPKLLLDGTTFASLLAGNAVAKSPLAAARTKDAPLSPGKIETREEPFVIVGVDDLLPFGAGARFSSQAGAKAHLRDLVRKDASLAERLQVVPAYLAPSVDA